MTWLVETVEAGGKASGSFEAQIDGLPGDDVVLDASVSGDGLEKPRVASATVHLVGEAGDTAWITPEEGGWMRSKDGRVELRFPAGAVKERTQVVMEAVPLDKGTPEHLFYLFRLDAVNEQSVAVDSV